MFSSMIHFRLIFVHDAQSLFFFHLWISNGALAPFNDESLFLVIFFIIILSPWTSGLGGVDITNGLYC